LELKSDIENNHYKIFVIFLLQLLILCITTQKVAKSKKNQRHSQTKIYCFNQWKDFLNLLNLKLIDKAKIKIQALFK